MPSDQHRLPDVKPATIRRTTNSPGPGISDSWATNTHARPNRRSRSSSNTSGSLYTWAGINPRSADGLTRKLRREIIEQNRIGVLAQRFVELGQRIHFNFDPFDATAIRMRGANRLRERVHGRMIDDDLGDAVVVDSGGDPHGRRPYWLSDGASDSARGR